MLFIGFDQQIDPDRVLAKVTLSGGGRKIALQRAPKSRIDGDKRISALVKASERAIELDPSYAQSYHWYADVLLNTFGRAEAAMPLLEKARSLDPLSPVIVVTLGEVLSRTGKVSDAVLLYRRAVELEPGFFSGYFLSAMAQLSLGDDELAKQWIDRGLARWPDELRILEAKLLLMRYREQEERATEQDYSIHRNAR